MLYLLYDNKSKVRRKLLLREKDGPKKCNKSLRVMKQL
jgi:hypothetical protein